jgi:hypothetical protein
MKIKGSDVRFVGIQSGILKSFSIIEDVYRYFDHEPVIMSLNDGNHDEDSLHYQGFEVDIRTRNINEIILKQLVIEMKRRLGNDYNVVLDGNLHIGYDPKNK